MPTGYTYPVTEGKITDFNEFAMSCARAFGALIMMRDESSDAEIPTEFKPSTYNADKFVEARKRLAELNAMTEAQAQLAADADFAERTAAQEKYTAEIEASNARLLAMQEKVMAWAPPTANHTEMKSFMLEQLSISMREAGSWFTPTKLDGKEWLAEQTKKTIKDIERHASEQAAEEARVAGRNEWLKQLRASLTTPADSLRLEG